MTLRYVFGWSSKIGALRRAAEKHGAGEAEIAALHRVEIFEATEVDIERLRPLAKLAGVEPPEVRS